MGVFMTDISDFANMTQDQFMTSLGKFIVSKQEPELRTKKADGFVHDAIAIMFGQAFTSGSNDLSPKAPMSELFNKPDSVKKLREALNGTYKFFIERQPTYKVDRDAIKAYYEAINNAFDELENGIKHKQSIDDPHTINGEFTIDEPEFNPNKFHSQSVWERQKPDVAELNGSVSLGAVARTPVARKNGLVSLEKKQTIEK